MQLYQFERIYSQMEKALLMAFDPYTNVEVMELLKQQENTEELSQEPL